MGGHWNGLNEAIPMTTHEMCILKNMPKSSINEDLWYLIQSCGNFKSYCDVSTEDIIYYAAPEERK